MKKEYLIKSLVFVFIYVALTKMSLLLALDEGFASAVWFGSGLALSLLFIYGNSMWPAITIAAFTVNYIKGGSVGLASAIAIGNTLEAIVAYNIVKYYNDDLLFTKLKGVITFIFASFLGAATSALIGGFAVTLGNSNFLETTGTWWLGDVVSCLLIVPVVTLFTKVNLLHLRNVKTYFSYSILIAICCFIFFRIYNSDVESRVVVFILFIFPLYASLSQSRLSALLKVFVIASFAVFSIIQGKGPFIYSELNNSLIIFQSFTSILTIVTLIVSVGIKEKELIEARLSAIVKEKELLVSEIHHRVKNNLAVVSGLISLQNDTIENKQLQEKLNQTQLRIKTIALVHDKLYKKTNITTVEFSDYIKTLTEMIQRLYETAIVPVKLILNIERLDMDIDKAVPLGLIVNELLTNSFKHAFKGKESGQIEINFYYKNKKYYLSVKDNGVGFESMDPKKLTSLGLTLVNTLSQQLYADVLIKTNEGTAYEFSFS